MRRKKIQLNGMAEELKMLEETVSKEYEYGFVTNIETDVINKGINEDVIHLISSKKNEPEWMLEWRLKAYYQWLKMEEPTWPNVTYPKINYQDIIYYAAPKKKPKLGSLDEVDPELLKTFDKLGISLSEQKRLSGVAVDVVMDSVSVATSFKEQLAEVGIIFALSARLYKSTPIW